MINIQTAERVSDIDASDNFVFQRSKLAYLKAREIVTGDILEIGTGSGYGIELIASKANRFVTIDKYVPNNTVKSYLAQSENAEFKRIKVPTLSGIPDNSFDYVVTFQVIEHIKNDALFVSEINRVLKKNGTLIVTTPNKKMSLTRNPWHIREYTISELATLLKKDFQTVKKMGVFGNEKIGDYYKKNKASVERITQFDIFNFQYRLPRQLLLIPYDILNRWNRRKLLTENEQLTRDIYADDYFIEKATDTCYDLFFIAQK